MEGTEDYSLSKIMKINIVENCVCINTGREAFKQNNCFLHKNH